MAGAIDWDTLQAGLGLDDWRIWATVSITVVCIVAIWLAAFWADGKSRKVIDLDAPMACGDITLEALALHDGVDPYLPIYLAIRGKVYDVTKGRNFYGPGGAYQVFGGKEVARALALMSTKESDCTGDLSDVSGDHMKVLADWEAKLGAKYGVVGQVVEPKQMTLSQLAEHDGRRGGADAPIYLAIQGVVFDVSRGRQFYGPGGMYPFAGKECARALATYSTELADCSADLEGLDAAELDALRDWEARFRAKYPVVGRLLEGKAGG